METHLRQMQTEVTDTAITGGTRVVWYFLGCYMGAYARYFAILTWLGGRPNASARFGTMRLYTHGAAYFGMFCMSPQALRNPFGGYFLACLTKSSAPAPSNRRSALRVSVRRIYRIRGEVVVAFRALRNMPMCRTRPIRPLFLSASRAGARRTPATVTTETTTALAVRRAQPYFCIFRRRFNIHMARIVKFPHGCCDGISYSDNYRLGYVVCCVLY